MGSFRVISLSLAVDLDAFPGSAIPLVSEAPQIKHKNHCSMLRTWLAQVLPRDLDGWAYAVRLPLSTCPHDLRKSSGNLEDTEEGLGIHLLLPGHVNLLSS